MQSGILRNLPTDELDLTKTLTSGQVFRFRKTEDGIWQGVLGGSSCVKLQQLNETVYWSSSNPDFVRAESEIRRFLRLDDFALAEAAETWQSQDAYFAQAWNGAKGVRILRQEPEECFFAFLCASVAPIARISQMQTAVATTLGEDLGDGFWRFPTALEIARADEMQLRTLGLGFRAKRMIQAAHCLMNGSIGSLSDLRMVSHADAQITLTQFFGVGAKIADCIALFSLDKDDAIPVDTHIWRMAQNWYLPELAGKSLTAANYRRVYDLFYDRFGTHSGWAQQTLFYRAAVGKNRVE